MFEENAEPLISGSTLHSVVARKRVSPCLLFGYNVWLALSTGHGRPTGRELHLEGDSTHSASREDSESADALNSAADLLQNSRKGAQINVFWVPMLKEFMRLQHPSNRRYGPP